MPEIRGDLDVIGAERRFADRHRSPCVGLALRVAAASMFEAAKVVVNGRHRRVAGIEQFPGERQRPPIERLGVIETAPEFVEHGEVVQQPERFGVLGSEVPLGVAKRPVIERLRFGIARGDAQHAGEASEGLDVNGVGVAIGGGGLGHLDRAPEHPLRLGEVAKLFVDCGQGVADVGGVDTRRTAHALDQGERVAAEDEGTAKPAALQLL